MAKRLIDADALMATIRQHDYRLATQNGSVDNGMFTLGIQQAADEQPTVDAVEVVHGRWADNGIPDSMLSGCSVCGFSCGAYTFNYCPNCGAKMDGERKNEK